MSSHAERYPAEYKYLYNTKRWKQLRLSHLRVEPLCKMCSDSGKVSAATVVDHITPHKGDTDLFFDSANLQSLCKTHHDSAKQKAERMGVDSIGCDKHGLPIDTSHHWHR